MDNQTCLSKMISPRDRRPTHPDWRGGVIQIHITRACDESCFHCTQASNAAGRPAMMTPPQFRQAVETLRDHWGVVGVFGGNPTISPHFEEICAILREVIPFERRGLWSNNPLGKGRICAATFNPRCSNINVHTRGSIYDEWVRDWPQIRRHILGQHHDSKHGAPFVAMMDLGLSREEINERVSKCDVNQRWSALIGVFRGELRAYFCELAYAQSVLHEKDPEWPDTGHNVVPGWWDRPMSDFAAQVDFHCGRCGMPLNSDGQLAIGGDREQVSATHAKWFRPKSAGRAVELVTRLEQLKPDAVAHSTDYIKNCLPVIQ